VLLNHIMDRPFVLTRPQIEAQHLAQASAAEQARLTALQQSVAQVPFTEVPHTGTIVNQQ
jgi:hypothetical protein